MDGDSDPVSGVETDFAITAGSGDLSATTATSDAAGEAEVTYTTDAADDGSTVTVSATAGSTVTDDADIAVGSAPVAPSNLTVVWDDGPVINDAENGSTSVSGSVSDCEGCTVNLQYEDSGTGVMNDTATVSGGTFSDVQNISGFADGTVLVTATVSNSEGSALDSAAAEHDGTSPTVTITTFTDPITQANDTNVTISISVTDETDISDIDLDVDNQDGSDCQDFGVIPDGSTTYSAQFDLSTCDDGEVSLLTTVTDDAGNTGTDTATAAKDTVSPSVTGAFAPNAETVILTFDESVEGSCADTEPVDFAYDADGTDTAVTAASAFSCSGSEVTLTFPAGTVDPAAATDEVDYLGDGGAGNDLHDAVGNLVANFTEPVVAGTP